MRMKHPLSLAVSLAVLGALPTGTLAQEGDAVDEMLEEVTVTGSRIQKSNLVSSSPVTQVDAEDFRIQGITRVEDLISDLPQAAVTQSSGIANGSTGTAIVDLRNLGPERTLVLIDGRRLPPGSPIEDGIGADLNQIPTALIRRAEVLTGGASAAYGSDAVAGVVNFIMVDDFEGVQIDVQQSVYQHENDNNRLRRLVRDSGFETADGDVTDGDTIDISFMIGGNIADGRGNITAYAGYREIDPILQADRDYSACSLDESPDAFECGGSQTLPQGSFTDFGTLSNGVINGVEFGDGPDLIVQGNQFVDRGDTLYNFGPLNFFQRPDERYTAGAMGHFEFNEHAEVYTQMMFMDTRTNAQIAPSGAFFVTDDLNCGNPFLSDQQFQVLCGQYGLDETQNISDIEITRTNEDGVETTSNGSLFIGRRNVEGGPRNDDIRHTSFRGVFGIRGDINDNWSYDFYGQYSEVSLEQTYNNDLSITRIGRALNVVEDTRPGSDTLGQPVCQSVIDGSDPDCVPWNVFEEGAVTQEALDYLVLPLFARGTTDQKVFSGYVTGNLGDYGIKLPGAETGVDIVVGAEYRSENLSYNPDQGYLSGDGAGQGGPTLGVNGGLDVKEFFLEASIPILEGRRFAEALTVDIGYRYSDYSTDETTDTYKVATAWTPVADLRVRASFQRAVRHANIRELFRPQQLGLFDMATDPCAGAVINGRIATQDDDGNDVFDPTGRTFEQCARSGVTSAQFGNISDSPAGQYNEITGGNEELSPEESDTISFGFVYSPEFVDGLNISVDYFDIEVEDAIDNVGSEFTLNRCLDTGEAEFCDKIQRGATTGTLWVGDDAITSVDVNIGFFNVEGIDISADYEFDISDFGSVGLDYVASYLLTWDREDIPGEPVVDCVGNWGATCENPKPEFINNLRATWYTPWDVTISGAWRHIGAVDDLGENQADFDSQDYFDLAGLWDITDKIQLRLGINNVFDKEPPLTADAGPSIYGNGNTFPGTYDALGRYMFLGLSAGF